MFDKELLCGQIISKNGLVKQLILQAIALFPRIKLIIAADGAFASKELLAWCIENNISAEMRMHSNRKVEYKGKMVVIRDIKELKPRGRQMARTIKVFWHELSLYITAQRRIDKHGEESIVFQVATYFAKPSKHVKIYKMRWPIEKLFRTAKQFLGLQECFSTNLDTQLSHVSSVLLAFSIAQLERKRQKFDTPEKAIRALKLKNMYLLKRHISLLDQIFGTTHA